MPRYGATAPTSSTFFDAPNDDAARERAQMFNFERKEEVDLVRLTASGSQLITKLGRSKDATEAINLDELQALTLRREVLNDRIQAISTRQNKPEGSPIVAREGDPEIEQLLSNTAQPEADEQAFYAKYLPSS